MTPEAFSRLLDLAKNCDRNTLLIINPFDMGCIYGDACFRPSANAELTRKHNFLGFLHRNHFLTLPATALYFHPEVSQGTAVTLKISQGVSDQPETLGPLPWLLEPLANRTEHLLYTLPSPKTVWTRLLDDDTV